MPVFPTHAKSRQLTRGDQLRDTLARLKALVGQLGYALGEEALNILPLFDEVSAGLAELQAQGQDVWDVHTAMTTLASKVVVLIGAVYRYTTPGDAGRERRAGQIIVIGAFPAGHA
jgi:hypothetical protein